MRLISDEAVLESYIVEKGLAKAGDGHKFVYCSGGVSGTVVYLDRPNDTPYIIKQALEFLKVKEDWPCPPDRVIVEYNANKVYSDVAIGSVPKPLFVDEENWIFVREAVPDDWTMWKAAMMKGFLDFNVAEKAIKALVRVHNYAAGNESVKQLFPSSDNFYNLRVNPYIEFTTKKYPELASEAERVCDELMKQKITLVHADYSPKNIMVCGDSGNIQILDFEAAHYGNPAFDIAFFFNHFILKSVKYSEISGAFISMLRFMYKIYFDEMNYMDRAVLEDCSVRTLIFMLLARVDGKSPVEYLVNNPEKQQFVREIAFAIRNSKVKTIAEAINIIEEYERR